MLKKTATILAALALSVSMASAATIQIAGSLVEGDKTFSDFAVSGLTQTEADNLSISTATSAMGIISISFNSAAFVTTSTRDIGLFYTVETDGSQLISGIGQLFNLTALGTGGNIAIGESVFSTGFVAGGGNELLAQSTVGFAFGVQDATDPDGEAAQGDQLIIAPPRQKVWVTKDIFLDANTNGLVGATIITQSFNQTGTADVPEPATMLLFSTALLGLGFMRRKKS